MWDFVDFPPVSRSSTFPSMLTILISTPSHFRLPNPTLAHDLHSLWPTKHKIGFPGWPESVLDPIHGFGVSIAKKGLCTSPFFKASAVGPLGCVTEVVLQILVSGLKGGLEPPFFYCRDARSCFFGVRGPDAAFRAAPNLAQSYLCDLYARGASALSLR